MSWKRNAIILASLAMSACGSGKMTDLEEYARDVRAREPGPIQPLPEIKQVDTFVFEPGDRRDPFVMDQHEVAETAKVPGSGPRPDPLRRKEELEQFALDSLRMLGTLQQKETMWGLLLSPDGMLHRVQVGSYIGYNNGQITRISEREIELTEIVSDGVSDWRERQAAIALRE